MAWQFAAGEILTAANLNAVTVPWNAVCQSRMSAPQNVSNNSATTLSFGVDDLDVLNWHAGGTPTLFTPTIAGWYQVHLGTVWQSDTDYTRLFIEINKNGGALTPLCRYETGDDFNGAAYFDVTSPFISMNGTTDNVTGIAFQTNTSAGINTVDAVITVKLMYPT
jgi:hypothetical protein